MSKKHNPTKPCQPYQPRPVKAADKAGDDLAAFPAACHVLTGRQRDLPNPTAALAELGQPQPSERARLRAASVQHEQREARARREAHQILTAAEGPAPTVHDDLQAAKRRPWDAPMATRVNALPQPPAPMICGIPDPLATLAWEAVITDAAQTARSVWARTKLPLAFSAWSLACFGLGVLARG